MGELPELEAPDRNGGYSAIAVIRIVAALNDYWRQQVAHASQPTAEVVEALQELTHLLERACVYVEQDAQMMADISRHSPLDTDSQAAHDGTVYDSERLRDEIPESLARARAALAAARKG